MAHGRRRAWGLVLGLALATACAPPASADPPKPPLRHDGLWITDAKHRVVILHGVNMVYKRPPYLPSKTGFNDNDARFLAEEGYNTVRVGVIYKAVEPKPGKYDNDYLDGIAETVKALSRHRIFSMLDFHQDLYNEKFTGEGFPDWAVIDDGAPAEPTVGFPGTYLTSPGLNQAFNNFWINRAGPGGIGLQDRYAKAWRHVAKKFRDERFLLGYDLINEPWPGSQWPSCAQPAGCPVFEQQVLGPAQSKATEAIRKEDDRHLVWYEPAIITQFGTEYWVSDTPGDPRQGMSFHIYCLIGGPIQVPGLPTGEGCDPLEQLSLENAIERAEANNDTLLLSEFGATDDLDVIERQVERADEAMVSWQYWHYCGCDDPTTSGPGDTQAIVIDPSDEPKGNNLKKEKLKVLSRAFPQVVAGTPLSFDFDSDTAEFDLEYSTEGVHGKTFGKEADTQVVLPRRHYPDGYTVEVQGAKVESQPGARVLVLENCPGVHDVTLHVEPGNGPVQQSC